MHPAPTPATWRARPTRSFSGQVGFLVVAVLVVTGLFNWTAAGRTMADFTRSEVERSTRSMAQAAADRISLIMTLGSIELAQAAEDPDLRAKDPIVTREALRRIQQNLRAEFPFEAISLVDTDGRQRAIDPPNPALAGADLAGHYCIGHLMATGRPYISDAFRGGTGGLLTVIAVPVTDPMAGTVGVLAGNLHLDMDNRLGQLLRSLETDGAARYVLLDGRHDTLYTSHVTGGAGTPFPAQALKRFTTTGRAELTDANGERWLGTYVPVPETGWGVLALVPASTTFANIWRFHRQTLVISILTLVGSAFISLALSRRLIRPLHDLIAALQAVARGRYDIRFSGTSTLEWQQLGEAFNRTVTDLAEYQRLLNERACRDPLTGVFNRGTLNEYLERELAVARQTGTPLSVLMIDIDDFKPYNDTFGHPAGDEVLMALGDIAARSVREVDLVARYGGEEFVVVLKDADLGAAAEVAERIRGALAAHPFLRPVTMSLGVAGFPEHGHTGDELISRADVALYAAKQQGKNRVVIHW